MKIVIYGIGSVTDDIEQRIRDEHEIVAYSDSVSDILIYKNKPFVSPDSLMNISFDYVVIAIIHGKTAWEVYERLYKEVGIPKEKLIPFYIWGTRELYRIEMESNALEDVHGLIFGNSMAKYGLQIECFSEKFINLSVISQDIYYNYIVFKHCMEYWRNKVNNLKYVIIDMYDYNVFNYDLSLTTGCFDYIEWGGCVDKHNFNNNKKYCNKFEDELFKNKYLRPNTNNELLELIFYSHNINPNLNPKIGSCNIDRWKHIRQDEPLTSRKFIGNIVKNRYEASITENIHLMNCFLEDIKRVNPGIKVIFTLLPRYIAMEEVAVPFLADWKNEFQHIMDQYNKNYGTSFIDFKNCIRISENYRFYYDVDHLNIIGGRCLTSILDKMLQDI